MSLNDSLLTSVWYPCPALCTNHLYTQLVLICPPDIVSVIFQELFVPFSITSPIPPIILKWPLSPSCSGQEGSVCSSQSLCIQLGHCEQTGQSRCHGELPSPALGVGKGSVTVPANLTPPHCCLQVCFPPHISISGRQDEGAALMEENHKII